MGGHDGFQRFLRCALHSWSRLYDPLGGACGTAGGHRGVGSGGARGGGDLMSHSTGGGAGEGARCHPP